MFTGNPEEKKHEWIQQEECNTETGLQKTRKLSANVSAAAWQASKSGILITVEHF